MLTVDAPAKLNLYLKVLSRRDDGYHEIETLFEKIDLCDTISIAQNEKDSITCDNPQVPIGRESLIGKCLGRFLQKTGINEHFEIKIYKKIPIAAGLGGGSSDAAAVLAGLNDIMNKPLTKEELIEIGGELGADIPFFLTGYVFAVGKGKGDKIDKAGISGKIPHILLHPPYQIHTKDIYNSVPAFSLTNTGGIDRMFNAFLKKNDITSIAENICNDLQPIVFKKLPVLRDALAEIKKAGAKGAVLSGSGPALFGIFDEKTVKEAKKILEGLFSAKKGWTIYEVYTYGR